MAINNGRLSFTSSILSRDEIKVVAVKTINVVPGEIRRYVVDGVLVQETTNPEWEGQIIFYREPSSTGYAVMYVAVDIDGTLAWKETANGVVNYDSRTGREWDPKAGFYNPLVPLP